MKISIGIIGLGFVGDALKNGFQHFGISDIKQYDPKICGTSYDDVLDTDVAFVCVPTPMKNGGSIDDTIVDDVLNELSHRHYAGLVVIKSTLLPTSVSKFINQYDRLRIATNPEFLTERRAREDFINTEWIILGGDKNDIAMLKELYKYVYRNARQNIEYAEITAEAAMFVKYMTNTWFAVKVSLMNEYYQLWSMLGNDEWDKVVGAFSLDKRVGPTHLQVPGPDRDRGWGGKCLIGEEVVHAEIDGLLPNLYNFKDLYDLQYSHNIRVASYNYESGAVEFKEIEGIRVRDVENLIKVKTDKGFRLVSSVDHNHLVFDVDNKSFRKIKACDLKIGQYIASINVSMNRDKITQCINLLSYDKVKWVKINRFVTDEEISFLYSNGFISRDQRVRLISGDRSILPKSAIGKLHGPFNILKIKTNTSSEFDECVIIDEDYAKIVGYYLAEGNITIDNRGNQITYFSFGAHEKDCINDLCNSLELKGFKFHHRIDKYDGHDSVNVVIVNNSILGYILTKLECGSNSKNKKIPCSIFNDDKLIMHCLSAYFRGDGTVKNGHGKYVGLNIASQSKILIEQINSVFRNIGVFASYIQKKGKKSTGASHQLNVNSKDDIKILINNLNLLEYENKFVLEGLRKTNDGGSGYTNYIELDNFILVRIVGLESIDEPTSVYSTQVKDNENFITSGNLLTANCFPKDLNALMSLAKDFGSSCRVMAAAWNDNAEYRSNRDWLEIDGAVSEDYVDE